MKQMKKGDQCFFYHSVDEKQIIGIVEVTKEYYPDETAASIVEAKKTLISFFHLFHIVPSLIISYPFPKTTSGTFFLNCNPHFFAWF